MGKKFSLDNFQLKLNQLIYIYLVSFILLGFSIWGNIKLHAFYGDNLPLYAPTFITISFILSGAGLFIGVGLTLYIIFEN